MMPGLPLQKSRTDAFLEVLERESIALFQQIKQATVSGPWDASPVEDKYLPLREALLAIPGFLRGFRHTFLAAGRHNFPDSPGKQVFLDWGGCVPLGLKWKGARHLWKMARTLYRHRPFRLADLDSPLIGEPSTYRVPRSLSVTLAEIVRRLRRKGPLASDRYCHITEAQIRYLYYRHQIREAVGDSLGTILEVGGGFGGLATDLLHHCEVKRFFLVELPDTLPLAYFYLRASFEVPVQCLFHAGDRMDPNARIVVLAPWMLPQLQAELDLLINTMSFQHMMSESVRFYLEQADRLNTRVLYLVNRDTQRDPTDLVISKYPIPSAYTLVSKRQWLFGSVPEIIYKRQSRDARAR